MKRRDFLKTALVGTGAIILPTRFAAGRDSSDSKSVTFGVCADVHIGDVIHDGEDRLKAFVKEMTEKKADFIIQLGDFCWPEERFRRIMELWDSFDGGSYHVMGNHERDGYYDRDSSYGQTANEQIKGHVLNFYGLEKGYYSFDAKGVHFIVLDGCDITNGYPSVIGQEQKEWLVEDLKKTDLRTVIFSHQMLEDRENIAGVDNRDEIRAILEAENERVGRTKVFACICGHQHTDFHSMKNGIYYIHINSMSYAWMSTNHPRKLFSDEAHAANSYLQYAFVFKDPLYATITIGKSKIEIEGKETEFVGQPPGELGIKGDTDYYRLVPYIKNKTLKIR